MDIINWINTLLTDYGMVNVIIMFIVILLTNIIKKPIINKADAFVAKAKDILGIEVDKSVITSNIIYIPIGLAFVLYSLWNMIYYGFDFTQISFSSILTDSIVYGMLSISIFEVFKSKLKSYNSKNSYKDAKEQLAKLEVVDVNVELVKESTEQPNKEPQDTASEISEELE